MAYDIAQVKAVNRVSAVITELTGQTARRVGKELRFRCPFHDDENPSLDVNDDKDGGVWRCRPCGIGGDVFAFIQRHQQLDFRGAKAFLARRGNVPEEPRVAPTPTSRIERPKPSRIRLEDIEREHLYRRSGDAIARKVLLKSRDADGKKRMVWQRPDGAGGWLDGLGGIEPGLYGLDEAIARKTATGSLIVCEGEKDAAAVIALGLPAVSGPHGAGKWSPADTAAIVAAGFTRPFVFGDHDRAGAGHNETVTRDLQAAGLTEARPVRWEPDSPEGFDVADFLAEHHTDGKALLIERCKKAEPWVDVRPPERPATSTSATKLTFTSLGALLAQPDEAYEWVVQDRIPAAGPTVLAGKPKAGKSTLARALALEVARGGRWLGFQCTPGTVWYLALEDKPSEVRKHFRQMGGLPTDPVHFVFLQPIEDLVSELHRLAAVEKPSLIIVDTLQRLIRVRDLNDYAAVTEKMSPLLTLCRTTGAAMLLVHHAGKGDRTGIDAVLGSTALVGSADNVLLFGRTDDYRVLSTQQRIGPDLPASVVLLDEETGMVSLGGTREEADIAAIQSAMLAGLGDSSSPMTEKDLCDVAEGRQGLKRKALRMMVGHQVQRTGGGKRGDPYLYSRTLVPTHTRERENEKPNFTISADKQAPDSRSRQMAVLTFPGNARERETGSMADAPEVFEV